MRKLNENIIMFESKTNVILYKNGNKAYLIDSGNDEKVLKEILVYLEENHLTLSYIINTHCHADHTFFNFYLQNKVNCKISSSAKENVFIENSDYNLDVLFGGNSDFLKDNHKLYYSNTKTAILPSIDNISYISLAGHSYDMIGIILEDKYFFVGDAIFSLKELNYFPFIYDVSKFINTLDKILKYKDKIIISSHIGIVDNLEKMILLNKKYVENTIKIIFSLFNDKIDLESLFIKYLDYRNLKANETTYFLYKSTFKSFINYMITKNILVYDIELNKVYLIKNYLVNDLSDEVY